MREKLVSVGIPILVEPLREGGGRDVLEVHAGIEGREGVGNAFMLLDDNGYPSPWGQQALGLLQDLFVLSKCIPVHRLEGIE